MHKFFAKTLFVGKKVNFLPQCHSTNEEAQRLVSMGGCTDGELVLTQNQTRGKGQRGNSWESEPGKNLTFSIVLKPHFIHSTEQFSLHLITSLAIHDVLFPILGKKLKVKWPNDIYYGDQKIAGILVENIIRGSSIEHSIIGIGLNVNQKQFETDIATSLSEITLSEYDLGDLIEDLLCSLEKRYLQLKNFHQSDLRADYHSRLYKLDKDALFDSEGKIFKGTIEGVDAKGRLKINDGQTVNAYDFKQVEFVRN